MNGLDSIGNSSARNGFRAAANYWSSVLTDDVTIVINVGYDQLDPGVLAQAGSRAFSAAHTTIIGQMVFDSTSVLDAAAVASVLPATAAGVGVNFQKAGYKNPATQQGIDTTTSIYDNDFSANNRAIIGNSAALKALNFGLPAGADATITFNSDFNFDFDARDGIASGYYDFIGVAVHEFGHALGFTSRVDFYDFYGCPGGDGCEGNPNSNTNWNASASGAASLSDLFRYSSNGVRNITPGAETYFSVDGGATEVYGNSNFSTGDFNGDGRQASHWKAPGNCNQAEFIGILNPYLCSGMGAVVKAQDLALLDSVGWDLADGARDNALYNFSSADIRAGFVPEPAVWMQLILGFGVIGGAYRTTIRRRQGALAAA